MRVGLQPGAVFMVNSGVASLGILGRCWNHGLEGLTSHIHFSAAIPSADLSAVPVRPCVPKVPSRGLAMLTLEVCGTFSVPGHSAAQNTQPQALPGVRQPFPKHDLCFSLRQDHTSLFKPPQQAAQLADTPWHLPKKLSWRVLFIVVATLSIPPGAPRLLRTGL